MLTQSCHFRRVKSDRSRCKLRHGFNWWGRAMIRISTFILATITSVAPLCGSTAQAMQIQQFDKMADADQDEYIVELVQGAQRVLNEAGRTADAQAVHKLYTTNAENGASIGMNDFMLALALARKSDADRAVKDPSATRLEVEHAMLLALKREGIVPPQSFMHVADEFRPKLPVR